MITLFCEGARSSMKSLIPTLAAGQIRYVKDGHDDVVNFVNQDQCTYTCKSRLLLKIGWCNFFILLTVIKVTMFSCFGIREQDLILYLETYTGNSLSKSVLRMNLCLTTM